MVDDDYTEERDLETSDGALISYWPSGHGMACDANFDPACLNNADPHRVWVSFHFLPGGQGATYAERMRCVKNSAVAKSAIDYVLSRSDEDFAPELVGVMAHIYADTFSHHGFSGLRSAANFVKQNSINISVGNVGVFSHITEKATRFFSRLAASATRGLGHSCVADFPDRPYLIWSFEYERGFGIGRVDRNNQADYFEGCQCLFEFIKAFRERAPQYSATNIYPFSSIEETIKQVVALEGKTDERASGWREAARNGSLGFVGEIPEYPEGSLQAELEALSEVTADQVASQRVWRFTRGVEVMRGFILNDLLPRHGLIG